MCDVCVCVSYVCVCVSLCVLLCASCLINFPVCLRCLDHTLLHHGQTLSLQKGLDSEWWTLECFLRANGIGTEKACLTDVWLRGIISGEDCAQGSEHHAG